MLSDLNMGHDHRRSGDLMRSGAIVVEALSYIRGRSIANQFMIIDEAQNLTPLEAKTIITRVGSGTKIIFTGDPYQIDNPYVDSSSNGFNYIVSRFRDQAIAARKLQTKALYRFLLDTRFSWEGEIKAVSANPVKQDHRGVKEEHYWLPPVVSRTPCKFDC
jgi:hypothetical protein